MNASPLLATECPPASHPPPTTRLVQSGMRCLSVAFTGLTSGESRPGEPVLLHISFQGFVDALWILVTEDSTCAPGVVMYHDGTPEELRAGTLFRFNGETPSVECDVLLGMRDHPLTNLVASTIAHSVRGFGEVRALVMCISVARTAKELQTTEEKKALLTLVKETVMELAKGGGEPQ